MKENLEYIDKWLKHNAKKIGKYSLQAPVGEEQWKELERKIAVPLPSELKELYLWHNGMNDDENTGSLFYGLEFCSVEKMLEDLRWREDYIKVKYPFQQVDAGIDGMDIYNLNWLMLGFGGSRGKLYVDLKPLDSGTIGQVVFVDEEAEVGILVAKSVRELVENFASDLEQKLYRLDKDALEDGEHYLSPKKSINLVNWSKSTIWKR